MKTIIVLSAVFVALIQMIAPNTAQAQIRPFAKVHAGYSLISDVDINQSISANDLYLDTDDDATYGISLGLTINKILDIEFEFAHAEYDFKTFNIDRHVTGGTLSVALPTGGSMEVNTYMFNFRYIAKQDWVFLPYIFAGIGIKEIDGRPSYTNIYGREIYYRESDEVFAWQGGIGMKYIVTKNIYLDASYRYQDSNNFELGTEREFNNHNFVFGIAYQW